LRGFAASALNKGVSVMAFVINLLKRISDMAKRKKMKGRSAKHGRNPAPYTKYDKRPYQYSAAYRTWFYATRAKVGKNNKYAAENEKEKAA
jgi:hypothetical protein